MKIYTLFDPEGKMVSVGLRLGAVTDHLSHSYSTTLWNALFEADTPLKEKQLLEDAGWKVKTGRFKAENQ